MSTREAKRSRASRVADCTRRLGHQDVPPCKHSVPHNSHAHPVFGLSKGDLSARMRAYQKIVFTSGADNESGTSCLFAKMMTMESCSLSSLRRSWSSPKHRRNKSAPIYIPSGTLTREGGGVSTVWRTERQSGRRARAFPFSPGPRKMHGDPGHSCE